MDKLFKGWLVVLLIIIPLLLFGQLANTPSPKFRINLRNTGQSSYGATLLNSAATSEVITNWILNLGSIVYGTPAIGKNGEIYIGSLLNRYLNCINPDGSIKWRSKAGFNISISSPAIGNDGKIYVGCMDNFLWCFNPDGTTNWRVRTGDRINSSPAIGNDGKIYVGSFDNYLYCFNPDGSTNWKAKTGDLILSSPAIGNDGKIYIGSDDNCLYCFNPDGTTNWIAVTGGNIPSSPVVGNDGNIYIASGDGYTYCLNSDGTTNWRTSPGSGFSSLAIGSDNKIYLFATGYLFCFNSDGTTNWKTTWIGTGYSSPVVGIDNKIYIATATGNFVCCINANGTINWTVPYNITGNQYSSPVIGPDGQIYIGGENSLYSFSIPGYVPSLTEKPKIISIQAMSFSEIHLVWKSLANASSYTLFRNTVENLNTAKTIAGFSANKTNYNDKGLSANTTYYYWIKAYNVGSSSGFSDDASSTTTSGIDDVAVYNNYLDLSTKEPAKIIFGKSGKAKINIYTFRGVLVKKYLKASYLPGDYVEWDGSYMDTDSKVAAGVYIVVITGDIEKKLKIIVKN